MTIEIVTSPWAEAERWARAIIALSGAALAVWALLRWPVSVILKAALMALVKATLRDEEARASLLRMLREQQVIPPAEAAAALASPPARRRRRA